VFEEKGSNSKFCPDLKNHKTFELLSFLHGAGELMQLKKMGGFFLLLFVSSARSSYSNDVPLKIRHLLFVIFTHACATTFAPNHYNKIKVTKSKNPTPMEQQAPFKWMLPN